MVQKIQKILEDRFLKFVSDKKLIKKGEKILLTVSGGMDSSAMAYLFSKTDFDFGIAHCNFCLRGNESDGDAEFVSSLSNQYQKPFHTIRFDTQDFAEKNKLSIQEAARILRYQWFDQLSLEFNYDKIATAHHLDDSIETFFINLLRGTGTAGLKGISPINKKIIRPLLFATRKEIEEYVKENNISYREDSTNASDDYLRNRIRHHIIPAISNEAEGFTESMEKLMEDFSMITDFMNDHLHLWKHQFAIVDDSGNTKIPIDTISKEKNPSSFLSLLLHSYGITGIDCKKILSAETSGKIFHAKNYLILRDREFLILQKKDVVDKESFTISELPIEINTGEMVISISAEDVKNKPLIQEKNKSFQIDQEKIVLPLTLRTWNPGDYFFPLGMKGKKKISDFYTDEKIDRFQKDKIYLLLSGNDIVCILGHRIDDRFKITPSTKKVLSIELQLHDPGTTTV